MWGAEDILWAQTASQYHCHTGTAAPGTGTRNSTAMPENKHTTEDADSKTKNKQKRRKKGKHPFSKNTQLKTAISYCVCMLLLLLCQRQAARWLGKPDEDVIGSNLQFCSLSPLTPSLPWCLLKTTIESVEFKSLKLLSPSLLPLKGTLNEEAWQMLGIDRAWITDSSFFSLWSSYHS